MNKARKWQNLMVNELNDTPAVFLYDINCKLSDFVLLSFVIYRVLKVDGYNNLRTLKILGEL